MRFKSLILVTVLLMMMTGSVYATENAKVFVNFSDVRGNNEFRAGEIIELELDGKNINDLYGYSINMIYDKNQVEVIKGGSGVYLNDNVFKENSIRINRIKKINSKYNAVSLEVIKGARSGVDFDNVLLGKIRFVIKDAGCFKVGYSKSLKNNSNDLDVVVQLGNSNNSRNAKINFDLIASKSKLIVRKGE